ncbi:MAG: LytTR family transcriptional regulator [Sporocytophaga sp.]|uniref:LytR/AlgR family response regulator transcription factor n=1 Tax=Sporocytophaga sp. TaxID=2231183 RepID=UPI001B2AE2C8|nr:LytTR family DNA-binding domain-containing protein [Sporocytophaga sp.]MBO9702238.1 LytTR family transcriptional regulator [Sporocytophaga sp.]
MLKEKLKLLIVGTNESESKKIVQECRLSGINEIILATGAQEALNYFKTYNVNICIIDCRVDHKKKIDLACELKNKFISPIILIVPALPAEILLSAQMVNPFYMLISPLKQFELCRCLELAIRFYSISKELRNEQHENLNLITKEKFLFVKVKDRYQKIKLQDIILAKASGNYTIIILKKSEILISSSLNIVEKSLPGSSFMRVHRSFVINIEYLESFFGNTLKVDVLQVPIGKNYRKIFLDNFIII